MENSLRIFKAHIGVNNTPSEFPKARFIVCTIDDSSRELWFYGAYEDVMSAHYAAAECNGVWFFNYGNAEPENYAPDTEECHREDFHAYEYMEEDVDEGESEDA